MNDHIKAINPGINWLNQRARATNTYTSPFSQIKSNTYKYTASARDCPDVGHKRQDTSSKKDTTLPSRICKKARKARPRGETRKSKRIYAPASDTMDIMR
jgi:hypothetical protein